MIKKIYCNFSLLAIFSIFILSCNLLRSSYPGRLEWEVADQQIFKKLKKTSVIMLNDDNSPYCSGNVISSTAKHTLILSCAHCFRDVQETNIRDSYGRNFKARIIARSAYFDLALLKTLPTRLPALRLHPSAPKEYSTVYTMGHPLGLAFTGSKGYFIALRRVEGTTPMYQYSAIDYYGSSGSAITDSRIRLIGVVSRGLGVSYNFAVPIPVIRQFLQEVSNGKHK